MCRVLDKLGESDRDNVHRWTDVGGMVSNSGGWEPVSRETRRELTETCSRASSSDRSDANAYVVNCARAIASISASSPGETPALSPATRMTEYLLFSAWQDQHLSARRGLCGEHRPSAWRPTADRWVPPAKLSTRHERCACGGEVSRETSSESLKDARRGSYWRAGMGCSDLSPGELPVLCRAMNTTWDLMHALTQRTEVRSAPDVMR